MLPVVLTLDIAKGNTGWAIGNPQMKSPGWGCFATEQWENDNEGRELSRFRRFLTDKHKTHGLTHIVHEATYMDATKFSPVGTEAQTMLKGVAHEFAFDNKISITQVAASTWRKDFLGVGTAPRPLKGRHATVYLKQLCIKTCAERGWYVENDDMADALGLLIYSLSCLDGKFDSQQGPLFRRGELESMMKRGKHAD